MSGSPGRYVGEFFLEFIYCGRRFAMYFFKEGEEIYTRDIYKYLGR